MFAETREILMLLLTLDHNFTLVTLAYENKLQEANVRIKQLEKELQEAKK